MLEKLGVDANDDFEKSAAELSKEASIPMDDAREQIRNKASEESEKQEQPAE